MTAYRDDLEAALQRTDDLEREVTALRERNQRVEAQLASGDLSEEQAEPAEYHNRPTQLQATWGSRMAASLIAGCLGFVMTCGLSADGKNLGAFLTLISFGGFVMWLNLIPRVDPPRRIK